ncbi:BGTF surface domain-containing protein [Haloarchaeobius sp. DFWS5]|uniref:DUF7827 domain-containing protein n=1 Tax=Haloarchaeobius sp. DFWS5 TaxID=3446114 RepID=UPI003EC019C8
MTEENYRVRSILLASLMVTSVVAGVVAFSGSATAESTDVTLAQESVESGTSVSVNATDDGTDTNGQVANGTVYVILDENGDGVYDANDTVLSATGTDGTQTVGSIDTAGLDGQYDVYAVELASEPSDGQALAGNTSATLTVQDSEPAFESAVEYDGNIEIAMSEPVFKPNSTAPLDGEDITVLVDGEEVSVSSYGDSTTGRLVLSGLPDIDQTQEVTVDIGEVSDASGNTVTPGTVSATVTGAVVTAGTAESQVPSGTVVAFDAGAPDAPITVERGSSRVFTGTTGVNSHLYVWDSADAAADETWWLNTSSSETAISLFESNLSVSSEDVTAEESVTATVTGNQGGLQVEAELLDSNNESVANTTTTLSGAGEATLDFGPQAPGNYSVTVTAPDSGTTAVANLTVGDVQPGELALPEGTTTDEVGDVAALNVSMTGTDTGIVHIGSADTGYSANVSITDGDGDGQVTLLVNTYTMGGVASGTTYSTLGSDSVTVLDETELPDTIEASDYPVTVGAGENATAEPQDIGTLTLQSPSTDGLAVWTAPQSLGVSSADDVRAALDSGALTQDTSIATGDVLVHELTTSGLEGRLAAAGGASPTEQFFQVVDGENVTLEIAQTNASRNRDPKRITLDASNTQVVANADNNSYYLVTSTGALGDVAAGEEYESNFYIGSASDAEGGQNQSASTAFTFVEREITFETSEGDGVAVQAAANQTLSGSSTLAPGSEILLRVDSEDRSAPFRKTASATVTQNGTWEAALDFSDVPENTNFSMTALDDEGGQATATGQVTGNDTESPNGTTTTTPGTTTAPNGTTTATTTGTTGTDTVTTAPGEGETDGTETTEAGDGPTDNTEPTEGTGDTVGGGDGTGTNGTTDGTGQPGFGVAAALIALVCAALLAGRRLH